MPLAPGTRIGPYDVAAQIGAGGMGEVYRATDTNLKRPVALKVLPAAVADDADRLARFQREAEVLASLNHPNIAAIYGLERAGATTALVMELVEGPTLADRLVYGALPVDEVLAIARQMAEALEAAHEQGIIHRDLKPANIKVRPDGAVKVLDFGLAKAMEPAGVASGTVSMMPTVTTPAMTQAGMILGTAAYMSPEQAKGRPVDRRTDVWAFGAVLYEMLTGRRAFAGDDVADTLASVLKTDPDFSRLPTDLSPTVSAFLRRCLQKDAKARVHDVADVRLAIEGAFDTRDARPAPVESSPKGTRLAWAAAAVAVVVAGMATAVAVRQAVAPSAQRAPVHVALELEDDAPPASLALSPDGEWLVLTYTGGLRVRSLRTGEERLLPGTGSPRVPFWSADSERIAFFADGKLKVVERSGGPPQVLCDETGVLALGGTWNTTGQLLFASASGRLIHVDVAKRACAPIADDTSVRRAVPTFLPDDRHFLYAQQGDVSARTGLFVASLDRPEGQRLLADSSGGVFVPTRPESAEGHLLFVRENSLWAQRFDADERQLSGDAVMVAEDVGFSNTSPQVAAAADRNGNLVFLASGRPEQQLMWLDRTGAERGRVAQPERNRWAHQISPDGTRVPVTRTEDGGTSVWVWDLLRGQETRLASFPASQLAGFRSSVVWSPDSTWLALGSEPGGVIVKSLSGQDDKQLMPSPGGPPSDWSRDGRWVIFTRDGPNTGPDIWGLKDPLSSQDKEAVPLVVSPGIDSQGQLSPDGQWLAYTSEDPGREDVHVRRFRDGAPERVGQQVSPAGGTEPRWRADGRELYYLEVPARARRRLMVVSFDPDRGTFERPRALFEFRGLGSAQQRNFFMYSPSADGERFLVSAFATEARPSLRLVLSWSQSFSTVQ